MGVPTTTVLSNWLAVVARMPPVTWRVEEGEVLPMPTEPLIGCKIKLEDEVPPTLAVLIEP